MKLPVDLKDPGFSPTKGNIIIWPDPAKEKTDSGLAVVGQEAMPDKGTVIACGTGMDGKPMQAQPGERIQFVKSAAMDIHINGVDYKLLREEGILVTLGKHEDVNE